MSGGEAGVYIIWSFTSTSGYITTTCNIIKGFSPIAYGMSCLCPARQPASNRSVSVIAHHILWMEMDRILRQCSTCIFFFRFFYFYFFLLRYLTIYSRCHFAVTALQIKSRTHFHLLPFPHTQVHSWVCVCLCNWQFWIRKVTIFNGLCVAIVVLTGHNFSSASK